LDLGASLVFGVEPRKITQNLDLAGCKLKERERRERKWDTLRFGEGARNYISGFEGSQAVSACPSGRGNAYDRNVFFF
jgi:hypothetical protein